MSQHTTQAYKGCSESVCEAKLLSRSRLSPLWMRWSSALYDDTKTWISPGAAMTGLKSANVPEPLNTSVACVLKRQIHLFQSTHMTYVALCDALNNMWCDLGKPVGCCAGTFSGNSKNRLNAIFFVKIPFSLKYYSTTSFLSSLKISWQNSLV